MTPYGAMGNNPVMYIDPDGEFLIPALLLFTEAGYEAQKKVSPVAVHINVHLFDPNQKGIE